MLYLSAHIVDWLIFRNDDFLQLRKRLVTQDRISIHTDFDENIL